MYRRKGKPTCSLKRCAKRLGERNAIAAASSTDMRRSSDSRIAVSAVAERRDKAVTIRTAIPGAGELVGRGVYHGMPKEVPQPVRDRHAVVVGEPAECAAMAWQLGKAGWKVTVVTGDSNCSIMSPRRATLQTGARRVYSCQKPWSIPPWM